MTNTKEGVHEDGHGEGQCDEDLWIVNRWKIRGTAMLEVIHTLNACMLWKFGYSFFGL